MTAQCYSRLLIDTTGMKLSGMKTRWIFNITGVYLTHSDPIVYQLTPQRLFWIQMKISCWSYTVHLLTQNSCLLFGTEVVYWPQTNPVLSGSHNQRLFTFFSTLKAFCLLWKHFVHFGYKSWKFCFSTISVTNCEMLPVLQAMCIRMITATFKKKHSISSPYWVFEVYAHLLHLTPPEHTHTHLF